MESGGYVDQTTSLVLAELVVRVHREQKRRCSACNGQRCDALAAAEREIAAGGYPAEEIPVPHRAL